MFHWISTGGIPHIEYIFLDEHICIFTQYIHTKINRTSFLAAVWITRRCMTSTEHILVSSVTRKSWRHWHQRDSPTSGVFRCVVKLDENDVRAPGATLHHDAPNQDVFGHVAISLLAISNGQFQYLIRISWKIAWRLEDVWFVVYFVVSPWYLTGGSAAVLPRRPSNLKAIE